jgi:hypothetical protein
LLEKAFAKAMGNYYNEKGGQPSNSLRALTGAPVLSYYIKSINPLDFWDLLHHGTKMELPMTIDT